MSWNDYADYKRKCITWAIVVTILWGAWCGVLGFVLMGGGVTGVFMIIFGIISGFMGGFAFGGALYATPGQPLVKKVILLLVCLVLSPILFVMRLIDLKKTKKLLED